MDDTDIELKTKEVTYLYQLKNYIKEIFDSSFVNFLNSNDAISFACGWLMLAYSTDYELITKKLTALDEHLSKNLLEDNIRFIIKPILSISELLTMNEEQDLYNNVLSDTLNIFLINLYKYKPKLDGEDVNNQKKIIDNMLQKLPEINTQSNIFDSSYNLS